jgi:hypothetical protein
VAGEDASRAECGWNETSNFCGASPAAGRFKAGDLHSHAFNEDRVKSATASRTLAVNSALKLRTGKAYIISVGVNRTESSPNWDLKYAANDARKLSEVVSQKLRATRQFGAVVPVLLVSDQPGQGKAGETEATKAHLQSVLDVLGGHRKMDDQLRKEIPGAEGIEKAQPEDLVLLTFSSHGWSYVPSQEEFAALNKLPILL